MEYKLVEGLPSHVESVVNVWLDEGWEILDKPFPRVNSDGVHLVVQPMVYNQPNKDVDPYALDLMDVMGNLVETLTATRPKQKPPQF